MTLYDQADKNIKRTWFLITGFLLFIISLGYLFSYVLDSYYILVGAVIISITMSITSYWKSDKIVLKTFNANPIEKKDNPELYRIVENLSITAGLPMPRVFVIESEQPNAFATGRDPEHAVIAVTSGLLKKLEKVELEGVIAHELSHIGNRDILLGTVVVVLVGTIVLLSDMFLRIGLGKRKSSKGGSISTTLAIVAAILAPLAAGAMRFAISRKREYLADSSGALLTRYPEGLARALEKISSDENVLAKAKNNTAHLFISSPLREKKKGIMNGLFMTHPPIEERVKILRGMK
jgi:heat shock protein HtpX